MGTKLGSVSDHDLLKAQNPDTQRERVAGNAWKKSFTIENIWT
jgi:hypothetical protein